jgi:hypothetical protein
MSELVIQKLTKRQKEQVRWMYLGGYDPVDIANKLTIEIETIRFFVFGPDEDGKDPTCLFQIKKEMGSAAISSFLMDKAQAFERTSGIGLDILSRSLCDLQEKVISKEIVLNLDDMKKLSSIVTEMDKINRLESGLATETITHMGLSREEARAILEEDPFAPKVIDAEFKEEGLPWLK